MRTLVVGCDASGKSTMLEGVVREHDDHLIESTATPVSRKFKLDHLSTLVDVDFIAAREALYLGLTNNTLSDDKLRDRSFVGTDASLVTRLSHDVMRGCIGMKQMANQEIIETWHEDESDLGIELPNIIVFTHAPFGSIRNRIRSRQKAGRHEEKFWGFNSPFFLESYQNRWKEMVHDLAITGFCCVEIDTSVHSPETAMSLYSDVRRSLDTNDVNAYV